MRRIPDPRTDTELVTAANAGDPDAFETLYDRYCQWVVALAHRLTGDRELALDVLQETFLYLLGKFPGFELRCQMKSLLYPVVRHLAIAAKSRARRDRAGQDTVEAAWTATILPDDERLHRLAAAVEDLSPGQREVVLLRFADDLALAEIATALEIPLGTVKSRLHNALAALRADERTKTYFER